MALPHSRGGQQRKEVLAQGDPAEETGALKDYDDNR